MHAWHVGRVAVACALIIITLSPSPHGYLHISDALSEYSLLPGRILAIGVPLG
jgi:hypothetical protein